MHKQAALSAGSNQDTMGTPKPRSAENNDTQAGTTVTRPTKLHDGGTPASSASSLNAFLRYSDNATRMRKLLGLEDGADEDEEAAAAHEDNQGQGRANDLQEEDQQGQANPGANPPAKSSRLSWELHPNEFLRLWFQDG